MYSKTKYKRPFLPKTSKLLNLPFESFFERDVILGLAHTQHADLAHDRFLGDLVLIRLLKLLDSDCTSVNATVNLPNSPVSLHLAL